MTEHSRPDWFTGLCILNLVTFYFLSGCPDKGALERMYESLE